MSSITTIKAPDAARMKGVHTSFYGDKAVTFEDGVAKVADLAPGLRGYFEANGYGIGGEDAEDPEPAPEPADPRELEQGGIVQMGTPLRDAAVDPQEGDFLPPTNAGEANPHGPDVVSPGIHAVAGPGPIVPGTVGDKDYQEAKETAAAEAVLTAEDQPVPEVTSQMGKLAAAEYDKTKATGKDAGLAQQVDLDNLTDEERDLLGLNDDLDSEVQPWELKGEALAAKLEELGLSDEGTADDKRDRIRIALTPAADLAGKDLESALRDAELTLTGSADDRRARLQEYRDNAAQGA